MPLPSLTKTLLTFIACVASYPFCLTAQSTVNNDSLLLKALGSQQFLTMLIDSAVTNNPEVNRVASSIGVAQENLQLVKKNIYNAVSFFSSYNYGTTGNATSGQLTNFTLSKSNYYNVGVGLNLPLTHIITRKNIIRSGELQVKMAQSEKENTIQFISQEVIRQVQELKLSQKLMSLGSTSKQGALINYSMAEKMFLKGDVNVTELSRVQDIANKSTIEFEVYINRFQTAYLQLENYTGVKLSNLIAIIK